MNQKQTGYLILLICIGALFVSMAPEVKALKEWSEMETPLFVGTLLFHVGSVIGAYIGGRITPISREGDERTRSTDK